MKPSTTPVPAETLPLGCKLAEAMLPCPSSALGTRTETNRPAADTDEDADDE